MIWKIRKSIFGCLSSSKMKLSVKFTGIFLNLKSRFFGNDVRRNEPISETPTVCPQFNWQNIFEDIFYKRWEKVNLFMKYFIQLLVDMIQEAVCFFQMKQIFREIQLRLCKGEQLLVLITYSKVNKAERVSLVLE